LEDPAFAIITPQPGQSNFVSTLENNFYYQLIPESGTGQLTLEDNSLLYTEDY
jgi:hypothetical protein